MNKDQQTLIIIKCPKCLWSCALGTCLLDPRIYWWSLAKPVQNLWSRWRGGC